jgi:hypothetical protein
VTLSVVASGATTYQWQKYVVTDWQDIPGLQYCIRGSGRCRELPLCHRQQLRRDRQQRCHAER